MADPVTVLVGVAVAKAVVVKGITFVINFMRGQIFDSIDENEVSLAKLRSMFQSKFGEINSKINQQMLTPLQSAEDSLYRAIIHLESESNTHDISAMTHHARTAESKADDAFHLAQNFDERLIATKIRMLCAYLIHGYFTGQCNKVNLDDQLEFSFHALVQIPLVQSILRDTRHGRNTFHSVVARITDSGDKAECLDVLSSLMRLRNVLNMTTPKVFEIKLSEDVVNMYDLQYHSFRAEMVPRSWRRILSLHAAGDVLYSGDSAGHVRVWNTHKMEVTTTVSGKGKVRSICVSGLRLFVLYDVPRQNMRGGHYNDISLKVYDTSNYELISTLLDTAVIAPSNIVGISTGHLYVIVGGKMKVYDVGILEELIVPSFDKFTVLWRPWRCVVSSDKVYICQLGSNIEVFRSLDHEQVANIELPSRYIPCCITTSDKFLCVSVKDQRLLDILVYNTDNCEQIGCLKWPQRPLRDTEYMLRLSETRLFACWMNYSSSMATVIHYWDLRDMQEVTALLVRHNKKMKDMVVLGNKLFTSSDKIHVTLM